MYVRDPSKLTIYQTRMGEQCSNNPSCEASPSTKSSAHGVPPAPAHARPYRRGERNPTLRPKSRRADAASSRPIVVSSRREAAADSHDQHLVRSDRHGSIFLQAQSSALTVCQPQAVSMNPPRRTLSPRRSPLAIRTSSTTQASARSTRARTAGSSRKTIFPSYG